MTEHGAACELCESSVHFSYVLDGLGWARAEFSVGAERLSLVASYLGEALDDLLRAVEELLDGATTASVSFAEEPGEYRWVFTRREALIWVRIEADRGTRGLSTKWGRQHPVVLLERTVPLPKLAAAIAAGADECLQREGELGYLEKWHASKFPLRLLHSLQRKAGLVETVAPPLRHTEPDAVRAELVRRWSALASGSGSVVETKAWLDDLPSVGSINLDGSLALRRSIRSNDPAVVAQDLAAWQMKAALYDSDPMEWHRVDLMRRLARSLDWPSHGTDEEVIAYWASLLDRVDVEAVLREHDAASGR